MQQNISFRALHPSVQFVEASAFFTSQIVRLLHIAANSFKQLRLLPIVSLVSCLETCAFLPPWAHTSYSQVLRFHSAAQSGKSAPESVPRFRIHPRMESATSVRGIPLQQYPNPATNVVLDKPHIVFFSGMPVIDPSAVPAKPDGSMRLVNSSLNRQYQQIPVKSMPLPEADVPYN